MEQPLRCMLGCNRHPALLLWADDRLCDYPPVCHRAVHQRLSLLVVPLQGLMGRSNKMPTLVMVWAMLLSVVLSLLWARLTVD